MIIENIAYLVEERLNLLLPLPLTDFVGISYLEELGGHLNKPFRLNSSDLMTIFSGSQNQ